MTDEFRNFIEQCLDDFYASRITKIDKLSLKEILCKKNPYLFKALNTERASEIIEQIVTAHITASDETMFGSQFFEPIAKKVSGGVVSPSEGVDMAVETDNTYSAYSVKSGPTPLNASAKKRQNDEFGSLRNRLLKLHKQFDPILAYSYGKKIAPPNDKKMYRVVAGQLFWEELTGDSEFYIKMVTLMQDIPKKHMEKYKPKYDASLNRLTVEFSKEFCQNDGSIDWEKLVRFVSGNKKI